MDDNSKAVKKSGPKRSVAKKEKAPGPHIVKRGDYWAVEDKSTYFFHTKEAAEGFLRELKGR